MHTLQLSQCTQIILNKKQIEEIITGKTGSTVSFEESKDNTKVIMNQQTWILGEIFGTIGKEIRLTYPNTSQKREGLISPETKIMSRHFSLPETNLVNKIKNADK